MYSITDKDGKEVDNCLYTVDIEKKTFYTREIELVIKFEGYDGWSFDTLSYCEFITGNDCKFKTWSKCKFNVGNNCELEWLVDGKFKTSKLNKGLYVIGDNDELYRDIDANWAILNSRHDDEFIRKVSKDILAGRYVI